MEFPRNLNQNDFLNYRNPILFNNILAIPRGLLKINTGTGCVRPGANKIRNKAKYISIMIIDYYRCQNKDNTVMIEEKSFKYTKTNTIRK